MTNHNQLPRSAPEAQGISSSALLGFISEAEQKIDHLHSLMIVRHGHVVAEGWWSPYAPQHPHILFSLSKSFTSTAIGLAVAEGRLTVDDRVLSFFPDDAPPEVSENFANMRVRHLLSMSTGNHEDTTFYLRQQPDGDWVKSFLARPVEHVPGAYFVYNSGATYMLSAIIQKLTGMTLLEYLQPRLMEPLNIRDATWESCPRGINVGGWGLKIKTEEIANFGQLYLQKGTWHGQQIVPVAWVAEASSAHVANDNHPSGNPDWTQGYGYQFWRCQHGVYRGDGAFGQYCVVMEAQDTVIAITSGVLDMQAVLNLIWERLLPALGAEFLPADVAAQAALERKLASLVMPVQSGDRTSSIAKQVSGQRYTFPINDQKIEAIAFDFTGENTQISIQAAGGEHHITCGNGTWINGLTAFEGGSLSRLAPAEIAKTPVAASGGWTAPNTYALKLCFYETAFTLNISCQFIDNTLTYNAKMNVAFGPTERTPLVGIEN